MNKKWFKIGLWINLILTVAALTYFGASPEVVNKGVTLALGLVTCINAIIIFILEQIKDKEELNG